MLLAVSLLVATGTMLHGAEKLKALLIDGQNNHDWRSCTPVLKGILEDTGRFTVEVSTTPGSAPPAPPAPQGTPTAEQKAKYDAEVAKWNVQKVDFEKASAAQWQQWRPKFQDYAVVVCNYTGDAWPEAVRGDFAGYVRNGGGLVVVHAADNSFPEWPEYNEMIAVGGWGDRNEKSGPMVRWRDGKVVFDNSPGPGGTHGPAHEFMVETRAPEHPIMKGLPPRWKHATDELYSKLRGPAKNLTVLATAYAAPDKGGTGENEPMLMTIAFGRGRVFHTALGHAPPAMAGLGFQVTLVRGTEWAATGQVTLPLPEPQALSADKAARRELPK